MDRNDPQDGGAVVSFGKAKVEIARKRYAEQVLKSFEDMEHAEKRDLLQRKAEQIEKGRGKPKAKTMFPTFCPFCGVRYVAEEVVPPPSNTNLQATGEGEAMNR